MTIQHYLTFFEELMRPTETLFRLVPPDKLDWKPTENSFTIGQQMAHMVGAIGLYAQGIATGEWGFTSMRERFLKNRSTPSITVDEALRALHENVAQFKQAMGTLSGEEFDEGEIAAPQFGGRVPRWRVAMLAVEHHINHKAELFMYLKLLGIRVHTGHLYRG